MIHIEQIEACSLQFLIQLNHTWMTEVLEIIELNPRTSGKSISDWPTLHEMIHRFQADEEVMRHRLAGLTVP